MSYENYCTLLRLIEPYIKKCDTVFRDAIEPGLKLAVTLHHLAEGASHVSIANHYRLGRSTVSTAIYDTCEALWKVLKPLYLKSPLGPAEWLKVAEGRELYNCYSLISQKNIESLLHYHYFCFVHRFEYWNFPNCLGAVDGKHITVQKPRNSGSMYFNYKSRLSLVLMAVCDAQYRFTVVDVGQPGGLSDGGIWGGLSDGGIWEASAMGSALLNGKFTDIFHCTRNLSLPYSFSPPDQVNLPPQKERPGDDDGDAVPYVFVGDEAFPMKTYLLRPYPGQQLDADYKKVFNYRLSRCRGVIENSSGDYFSK